MLLLLGVFLTRVVEANPPLTRIEELRYWSYAHYTRVTVVLTGKVSYRVFELPPDPLHRKEARIAVDLEKALLPPEKAKEYPVQDGLLRAIRIAQYNRDKVRLVLDLEHPGDYEIFLLPDPFRLVIDYFGNRDSPPPHSFPSPPSTSPSPITLPHIFQLPEEPPLPPPVSKKSPFQNRRPTIVLDPGHGGKDPGAIGYKKLKEKDLVLDVALRVGRILKKKGFRIVYTRTRDEYISLEERTLIANREEADLFVSIHANSSRNREAFGIETYYLSTAFDHATRILAARENGMSPESIGELEELLLTLELSNRKQVSHIFARWVQKSVLTTLNHTPSSMKPVRDLGVKGAPFYVLIGSRMPAILVEIGFITHPREGRLLFTPRYRQKIAEGIASGIWQYWKVKDKVPL